MNEDVKLVCFDLNKTLIKENSWYHLNLAMGVGEEEDKRLFDLYEAGKIDYFEWQKELERTYKKGGKATRENILNTVTKYTYLDGAKETVRYLKEKGYKLALISGSMQMLVECAAKDLGIEFYEANNVFEFNDKGYLQKIVVLGDEKHAKLELLENVCEEYGVQLTETCCVGDRDNDIELFKTTGKGITFSGSKIEKHAWKVIDQLLEVKDIL